METALEHILTSAYKEEMISFMKAHPEYFKEAVDLAIADKHPYSWRAAWLLWSSMEENDPRIQEHIQPIIDAISAKKSGHQRELLKILSLAELNEEHEGYLFNICMTLWETISLIPSVRYFAFLFILKMVKKYPDLSNEMDFLMQDHYMDSLSPGIKNSISRRLKEFNL